MNDHTTAFNAEEYDKKIKMALPFYEDFFNQISDIINTQFHSLVSWLDIGCGTGKMEEVAFNKCNTKRLVATDISKEMTEMTSERFSDKNIEVITSSIEDLNLSEKFDVITSVQVFHYLQKQKRIEAIKKCFDLLNDNGILISFENFAPNSETSKKIFLERWKAYQQSQGKSANEANKHISRYNKGYFPITIEEHLKVFRKCGFKYVDVFWVSNMQVGIMGIK